MKVYELRNPGCEVVIGEYYDETWAALCGRIQVLFDQLENELANLVISLELFEDAQSRVQHELAHWGRPLAENGWPPSYVHKLPFLYARAFVGALDMMAKVIAAAADEAGEPCPQLVTSRDRFLEAFPGVRSVRNSIQHSEDRARRRGPHGKTIHPKPFDNGAIADSVGAMISDNLTNNRYGTTTASGEFVEIEVSEANVALAATIAQSALDAVPWRQGPVPQRPA